MPTPSFINIIIRGRGIDLFLIISFILPLVDVVPEMVPVVPPWFQKSEFNVFLNFC
jgi:hypothetical protein